MSEMCLQRGALLMREGDHGCNFFIIRNGTCEVSTGGQLIRRLVAGDSFGELSLASGEPRSASIVVTSETCSVLVASKRLMTASGFLTVMTRKREEWGAFLIASLPSLVLHLNSFEQSMLVDLITPYTLPVGSVLTKAGEPSLSCIWIVKEGILEEEGTGRELSSGAIFGHQELLTRERVERRTRIVRQPAMVGRLSDKALGTLLSRSNLSAAASGGAVPSGAGSTSGEEPDGNSAEGSSSNEQQEAPLETAWDGAPTGA